MPPLELAVRSATVAILLLTGIVILRDRRHRETGPYGGLLALSVAADSIVTIVGYPLPAWLWPLQLIGAGTASLLWIWTGAVFVDDYRPSWRDAVAWAVLPAMGAYGLYAWRPWIGSVERALALLFILLAAWRIVAGLRGDLVERRRRLRPLLAALAVLYAGGILLVNMLGGTGPMGASGRIVDAALLAALASAFALFTMRGDRSPFAQAAEASRPDPDTAARPSAAIDDQEDALLARLRQLMEEEKVYRREGFGVSALVAALDVPEYRVRRLINQRLGHRNFSSFVNGYRLAEAMAALADPAQADVPILTIALDTGFQSIGPFNRAFKAHTGMTPTAYRKQADSRTQGPIQGIGQSDAEIGKT
jgi:AraC-like DNA-binding protein